MYSAPSPFPRPTGARCCDNCEPDKFPTPTVRINDPNQLRLPGRLRKSSPELAAAVRARLYTFRDHLCEELYGSDQCLVTGKMILQDEIIDVLAERARRITSLEALRASVYWHFHREHGEAVAEAIREVLLQHPDPAEEAREQEEHERALRAQLTMKKRDLREKLEAISEACFKAVEGVTDGSRKVYQMFNRLPPRNVSSSLNQSFTC